MYNLICCTDNNDGIGFNNAIPWVCKDDMIYFKNKTINNIVIMGKNTWLSIKNPLYKRFNIVISNDELIKASDKACNFECTDIYCDYKIHVFSSIDECENYLNNHIKFKDWCIYKRWVIGGSQIYNSYLKTNKVINVYINKLKTSYTCDTYFKFDTLILYPQFKLVNINSNSTFNTLQYQYINKEEDLLLDTYHLLINKSNRFNRTNDLCLSNFGNQFTYIMEETDGEFRLPLLTTKKMFYKGIVHELLWFISGSNNVKDLEKHKVNIWSKNTTREFLDNKGLTDYEVGEMGPNGYGFQWRHWGAEYIPNKFDYKNEGIDQLAEVIRLLKEDPFSRRIILHGWNVSNLDQMALPPCLLMYQFYVEMHLNKETNQYEKYLSCMATQRSADLFHGVPFNIASMAILTLLISSIVGMKPYKLIHSIGDLHLYTSHIQYMKLQVSRQSLPFPRIKIVNKRNNINDFKYDDLKLIDYYAYSSIAADMVV